MDPSAIILLLGSAAISFGIGRAISRWRTKRQLARVRQLAEQARAQREAFPAPAPLNKSKRKREQTQQRKAHRPG